MLKVSWDHLEWKVSSCHMYLVKVTAIGWWLPLWNGCNSIVLQQFWCKYIWMRFWLCYSFVLFMLYLHMNVLFLVFYLRVWEHFFPVFSMNLFFLFNMFNFWFCFILWFMILCPILVKSNILIITSALLIFLHCKNDIICVFSQVLVILALILCSSPHCQSFFMILSLSS